MRGCFMRLAVLYTSKNQQQPNADYALREQWALHCKSYCHPGVSSWSLILAFHTSVISSSWRFMLHPEATLALQSRSLPFILKNEYEDVGYIFDILHSK